MPKKTNNNTKKKKTAIDKRNSDMIIVGIGASAGGLEALRALISGLPVQNDMTYVIAQHLDPRHSSMLGGILQRDTDVSVVEIKHKLTLKPATIYLIPPGHDAFLENNTIMLEEATGVGPKPSVDRFFLSLAKEKGEKAVGIILSGTGSDGAHGMLAIKAEGGITIAQTIETAKFASMPHASINAGHVDLILEAEKIGPQLSSLVLYPRTIPSNVVEIEETDYLARIFQLILNQTGGDFRDYKPATINRRIQRRMAVHRVHNVVDYLTLLESMPEEIVALHQDLLVSVTAFFRDKSAFSALKDNLKKIVDSADGEIRIWVAGCATGEEAYSIAILLSEHLGNRINDVQVQIFATDLDEPALAKARQGFYPRTALNGIDDKLLKKYFSQQGDAWQVVASIRDMILFAKHDLVKAPPFSHIDLITCRNVLIYFNNSLQERVLQTFHYALESKGLLFLGRSETTSSTERLFSTVSRTERLYQKRDDIISHLPHLIPTGKNHIQLKETKLKKRNIKLQPADLLDKVLAGVYKTDCVLLNQYLEVTYVRGNVTPFLSLGEGRVELNACDLIRSEYRHDLRGLLYKAKREDEAVHSRAFRVTIESKKYTVRLTAKRFADAGSGDSILLLFDKTELNEQELVSLDESQMDNLHIQGLNDELRETKESLQTTIEELETSNEELQSTYEEAQSTNEELYTSTEELQTSNEELQSTNEELRTVNQELNVKSAEVESTNDRLKLLNQQLEAEIDERKLVELKLSQQEKKLRTIIDSEPAWVNICDENGKILEVNPAGVAIMEATSDKDLVGKKLPDFVASEYLNGVMACIDGLDLGVVKKQAIEIKTLKGNMRWLEVSTVLLPKVDGEKIHVMSIICDQTQYKKAHQELLDRQEEFSHIMRLNTLGAMASGLAHELNQPLSAITNYLNGCERRVKAKNCQEEEVLKAISLASMQAQRAGDIINHVKHFVQQGDVKQEKIDLNVMVDNAINLFNATGQSGKVEYKLRLAKKLPYAMASGIQIEQVLINLIRNGTEAMQEAEVKRPVLTITSYFNKASAMVGISVEDMGNGISKKMQGSIFKPFQTSKDDGMGMGLCISQSIVETYSGYFTVKNSKKAGAVFSFEIPADDTFLQKGAS